MTKDNLSKSAWFNPNLTRIFYPEKDVKKHIQNAQRRLKEEIPTDFQTGMNRIINKIFLEEFGEKLI